MISTDQKMVSSARKVTSIHGSPKFGSNNDLDLADMNNLFSGATKNVYSSNIRQSVKAPVRSGLAKDDHCAKAHPQSTKNSSIGGRTIGFGAKRTAPQPKGGIFKKL